MLTKLEGSHGICRVYPAVLHIASGDVMDPITAIHQANANSEDDVLHLAPGTYTLHLPDNASGFPDGSNGLPIITGTVTLIGADATTTIIERDLALDFRTAFRFFLVDTTGHLTLAGLTLRGGTAAIEQKSGGAIDSRGSLRIVNTVITDNRAVADGSGGGILAEGALSIAHSLVTRRLTSSQRMYSSATSGTNGVRRVTRPAPHAGKGRTYTIQGIG